jgi:hypothetical protein
MYQQKSRTTALFKKGMDWTHLCSCRLIIPAPVRAFAYSGAHEKLIQFLLHADGENPN